MKPKYRKEPTTQNNSTLPLNLASLLLLYGEVKSHLVAPHYRPEKKHKRPFRYKRHLKCVRDLVLFWVCLINWLVGWLIDLCVLFIKTNFANTEWIHRLVLGPMKYFFAMAIRTGLTTLHNFKSNYQINTSSIHQQPNIQSTMRFVHVQYTHTQK